jgi:hypothetical protein
VVNELEFEYGGQDNCPWTRIQMKDTVGLSVFSINLTASANNLHSESSKIKQALSSSFCQNVGSE